MRLANPWKELREALGGARVALGVDSNVSDSSRSNASTLKVKAKDVHVGDLFRGCQVVHKETIGNRSIVLLTLVGTESEGLRAWRWSNEMVDVHRRARVDA